MIIPLPRFDELVSECKEIFTCVGNPLDCSRKLKARLKAMKDCTPSKSYLLLLLKEAKQTNTKE